MIVNRSDLLSRLEAVQPGLSPKEYTEQSTCFAFKKKMVITFNDEIACQIPSGLNGIEGVVKADPLLRILRKLTEDKIEVETDEDENKIVLWGKGRMKRTRILLEEEITMPLDKIEIPAKWKPLHEDFTEAITIVKECAATKSEFFDLTCVHIHPKWIEAFDNDQMTRYRLPTGVSKSVLLRRESIKHVVNLDMTEFSETTHWFHFRNPAGLILSCRRFAEEYRDLSVHFKDKEGEPASLPKGLIRTAERAEVFSGEDKENNKVKVDLIPGKVRISSVGTHGDHQEVRNIKYKGRSLGFSIAPKLLCELTKRHNECLVTPTALKVDGGKWVYITSLGVGDNGSSEGDD